MKTFKLIQADEFLIPRCRVPEGFKQVFDGDRGLVESTVHNKWTGDFSIEHNIITFNKEPDEYFQFLVEVE